MAQNCFGVLQDSILWPVLFNILLADLFFIVGNMEIASLAAATHHM